MQLQRDGKVKFTPGKNLPDNRTSSHDDRYILDAAALLDDCVLSNDNYTDLLHKDPSN